MSSKENAPTPNVEAPSQQAEEFVTVSYIQRGRRASKTQGHDNKNNIVATAQHTETGSGKFRRPKQNSIPKPSQRGRSGPKGTGVSRAPPQGSAQKSTANTSSITRGRQRSCSESSGSSTRSRSESPTADKPEFQTTIFILCPFHECPSTEPITVPSVLVQHLRDQHDLEIRNIHHMFFSLYTYLRSWALKLKESDDVTLLQVQTVDLDGKNMKIIDPKSSTYDADLRTNLQREKLNEILQIQEKERHVDSLQSRKCLFCKNMCSNRAALFRHMFAEHNFNIGLHDNLVNVEEFLFILEEKLNKVQCLYCEKIFTSPAVLRKHMRKKKHFKISARNRVYDRFYIINFLEPGKNWENWENEKYESDEDRQENAWADWEEQEDEPTMCLFESHMEPSPKAACDHMSNVHGFNLIEQKKLHNLDFYKTITLINFIRYKTSLNTCMGCDLVCDSSKVLLAHMTQEKCFDKIPAANSEIWKDTQFLFPTYENDPLLIGFDGGSDYDENSEVDGDAESEDHEAVMGVTEKVSTCELEEAQLPVSTGDLSHQ